MKLVNYYDKSQGYWVSLILFAIGTFLLFASFFGGTNSLFGYILSAIFYTFSGLLLGYRICISFIKDDFVNNFPEMLTHYKEKDTVVSAKVFVVCKGFKVKSILLKKDSLSKLEGEKDWQDNYEVLVGEEVKKLKEE